MSGGAIRDLRRPVSVARLGGVVFHHFWESTSTPGISEELIHDFVRRCHRCAISYCLLHFFGEEAFRNFFFVNGVIVNDGLTKSVVAIVAVDETGRDAQWNQPALSEQGRSTPGLRCVIGTGR